MSNKNNGLGLLEEILAVCFGVCFISAVVVSPKVPMILAKLQNKEAVQRTKYLVENSFANPQDSAYLAMQEEFYNDTLENKKIMKYQLRKFNNIKYFSSDKDNYAAHVSRMNECKGDVYLHKSITLGNNGRSNRVQRNYLSKAISEYEEALATYSDAAKVNHKEPDEGLIKTNANYGRLYEKLIDASNRRHDLRRRSIFGGGGGSFDADGALRSIIPPGTN